MIKTVLKKKPFWYVLYIPCSKLPTVYRCQAEAERCQAEAERYQAEAERIRKGRHFKLEDSELERPKKKLKMEDKPYSGFKFVPGEIIDLT